MMDEDSLPTVIESDRPRMARRAAFALDHCRVLGANIYILPLESTTDHTGLADDEAWGAVRMTDDDSKAGVMPGRFKYGAPGWSIFLALGFGIAAAIFGLSQAEVAGLCVLLILGHVIWRLCR